MNEREIYLARLKTILKNARSLGWSDDKLAEELAETWYWETENNRRGWFDSGYKLALLEDETT